MVHPTNFDALIPNLLVLARLDVGFSFYGPLKLPSTFNVLNMFEGP